MIRIDPYQYMRTYPSIRTNFVSNDGEFFVFLRPSSRHVIDAAATPTSNALVINHNNQCVQVAAAQQAAHTESLQVMSKRLAELYSEMGLPVGAGGGMPGAK